MVSTTDFIAAIELGSSKIAGIAGKKNENGSIQVLAYASEPSASLIKKGVVFNIDKTAQALTSVRKKLEDSLNSTIGKVYVGVGGKSLHSVENEIGRNMEEEIIISQQLIDSICGENLDTPLSDLEILDVVPQEYLIGINKQADPIGVAGDNIEGHFLNLVARPSVKKKLIQSFSQAGLPVAGIIVAPPAAAEAVLTDAEKRQGCALIDFGADTTTVSVYKNNILRFLVVIPLGGNSVTHDITSLQIEELEAEGLKIKYGDMLFSDPEKNGLPDVIKLEDGRTIDPQQLNEVISARAEEIIANAFNQIELSGFAGKLLGGIIITGGSANLKNTDEFIKKKMNSPKVRVAGIVQNDVRGTGMPEDGTRNTILGLLCAGKENCYASQPEEPQPATVASVGNKDLFGNVESPAATKSKGKSKKSENTPKKKSPWSRMFNDLTDTIFGDEDMK